MIRINLLPQAKRQVASSGISLGNQSWYVGYVVAVGLTLISLGVVYLVFKGRLDEQVAANEALQTEIANLRERSKRLEEVKAQLQASIDLENVVAELNAKRFGPLRVFMEVSSVLSSDGGPTMRPGRLEELRQQNPLAGFNPSWDVRRLWVKSMDEGANRDVVIRGRARTNEDIAEFMRRLSLSEFFTDIVLVKTQTISSGDSVDYEIKCKVVY